MNYKIVIIAAVILTAISVVLFKKSSLPQIIIPTPTPNANISPIITTPKDNDYISSPTTITGMVPMGWMFEGVFPIKLLDKNKKLIVSTLGKEKVPGNWQSGNPVEFKATLNFTTTSDLGYLVLENDNPSGDPKNLKTFEIVVYFNKK